MSAERLLQAVAHWAATAPGVAAVALVGSHARGTAGPDSDIDLVVLADDPQALLGTTAVALHIVSAWLSEFGRVERVEREDWGALQSLRAFYEDGLEVEFGIAPPQWAALPADPGTAQVVEAGMLVVHDPRGILTALAEHIKHNA